MSNREVSTSLTVKERWPYRTTREKHSARLGPCVFKVENYAQGGDIDQLHNALAEQAVQLGLSRDRNPDNHEGFLVESDPDFGGAGPLCVLYFSDWRMYVYAYNGE